jgi:hypothetical protein
MTTKPHLSRVSRDLQRKEDDEPQPRTSRARRGGTPESGRSVRPKGANLLGEVIGARVHVIGRKGWDDMGTGCVNTYPPVTVNGIPLGERVDILKRVAAMYR